MPMFYGSRDGLKPRCNFTEEEAKQLIKGAVAEQIGEPTEYIDEVEKKVDEIISEQNDGLKYAMIFRWDYETTGHLWLYHLRKSSHR